MSRAQQKKKFDIIDWPVKYRLKVVDINSVADWKKKKKKKKNAYQNMYY